MLNAQLDVLGTFADDLQTSSSPCVVESFVNVTRVSVAAPPTGTVTETERAGRSSATRRAAGAMETDAGANPGTDASVTSTVPAGTEIGPLQRFSRTVTDVDEP